MKSTLKKLLLSCGLLVVVVLPSFAAEDVKVLKKRLRSPDPQIARKALQDLEALGETGRAEARLVLSALLDVRGKVLARELKGLKALLKRVEDPKMLKELKEDFTQWEQTCQDVENFLFSNNGYPARYGGTFTPGEWVQPGQILLEARTERLVLLFNQLEAKLLKALGKKVRCPKPGGLGVYGKYKQGRLVDKNMAVKMVIYNFLDGTKQWAALSGKLSDKYLFYLSARGLWEFTRGLAKKAGMKGAAEEPRGKRLCIALGALFAGDYAAAKANRPPAGSMKRRIFNLLACRNVILLNHDAKFPWSKEEKTIFHSINLYRIVLGFCPVRVNRKLMAAAKEHSNWQMANKKSIYSGLVPGLDSPEKRMKRLGYLHPAAQGEFVLCEAPRTTMWMGRMSSGAHRRMVNPNYRAGGIAITGIYMTMNFGDEMEDSELNELVKE